MKNHRKQRLLYILFDFLAAAAAPEIPKKLLDQLDIGGILVIPEGDSAGQKMIRIKRISEKDYQKSEHGYFSFVPLLRGKNS